MTRRRVPPTFRGFTLVEVLVAMSIMAIVAVMSWQGVDGIVRSRDISESHLNRLLRLNTVLAQFKEDLTAIHHETARTLPSFKYDGARMTIVRRTTGGVQVVVWSLRNDAWYRWSGPAATTVRALQDSWLSSQQLIGNEAGQLKTVTGLTQVQVFCGRDRVIVNCQSTATSTAASSEEGASAPAQQVEDAAPEFVQLILSFSPDSGLTGNVTRSFLVKPL